jgi:hypothetical protein
MKSLKKWCLLLLVCCLSSSLFAMDPGSGDEPLIPEISDILESPGEFAGKIVSVNGSFEGWRDWDGPPPVSRSDWTIKDGKSGKIYCNGTLPTAFRPDNPGNQGKTVNVMGKVEIDRRGRPYLTVVSALPTAMRQEAMVSVAQILFDPLGMKGRSVILHGVLTKGYDSRGARLYFLADPTGAVTLERLPKLYPRGTILRLRGRVNNDSNGLPQISQVEIISANP